MPPVLANVNRQAMPAGPEAPIKTGKKHDKPA